jgi:tetratricopeptide (TPR) repeat protein
LSESNVIENALEAVKSGDPEKAREALMAALTEHPERLDLVHALAVTELQLGRPEFALDLVTKAMAVARERDLEEDRHLLPQLLLARGAACEELSDPKGAQESYETVLSAAPEHPLALQGLGHLLLAWGQTDKGLEVLQTAVDAGTDDPEFTAATETLIGAVRAFVSDDVHPKMFIEAHRGSYVEFFDYHAEKMDEEGWIAEAARMKKDEAGEMVMSIPDGARPYAAIRVDLVDPATGQAGLVGDHPMVVALSGYEPLAHAPVLGDWPGQDMAVWVSSQCPWDQLPIVIAFESGDAVAQADPTIGDWYSAGFDGDFGTTDRGRLHYISDPDPCAKHTVRYHVDCGRAEHSAIEDLLQRLSVLHQTHPIRGVLIGRGFVPIQVG